MPSPNLLSGVLVGASFDASSLHLRYQNVPRMGGGKWGPEVAAAARALAAAARSTMARQSERRVVIMRRQGRSGVWGRGGVIKPIEDFLRAGLFFTRNSQTRGAATR